jgi:DNA polymerase-3 subunit alpha
LDLRDSFSDIHSLSYSFVGFQTAYLSSHWNSIYWNTACLIVDSGSLENNNLGEDEKEKNTDYGKLASAIGDITSRGVKISLVDINFMQKCYLNKTAMISLIKAGAFDNVDRHWASELCEDYRFAIMVHYLLQTSDLKKKLTLQNFNSLIKNNILPQSFDFQKKVYYFNKQLKQKKIDKYYQLPFEDYDFYKENFEEDLLSVSNNELFILQKDWDKIYKLVMEETREWLNNPQTLKELNSVIFKEAWDKYASGSLADWEMESLCFYYHEHPLKKIDNRIYGIVNFNKLSAESAVEKYFKRGNREIPIFKLSKIAGTVLSKNDTRSSIKILTPSGVVNVKFTKEYYASYARQLSEKQEDGCKKIIEKSWFTRGTKLLIQGFRRDDSFIAKSYKDSSSHQLYKITEVKEDGTMTLVHYRYGEEENG